MKNLKNYILLQFKNFLSTKRLIFFLNNDVPTAEPQNSSIHPMEFKALIQLAEKRLQAVPFEGLDEEQKQRYVNLEKLIKGNLDNTENRERYYKIINEALGEIDKLFTSAKKTLEIKLPEKFGKYQKELVEFQTIANRLAGRILDTKTKPELKMILHDKLRVLRPLLIDAEVFTATPSKYNEVKILEIFNKINQLLKDLEEKQMVSEKVIPRGPRLAESKKISLGRSGIDYFPIDKNRGMLRMYVDKVPREYRCSRLECEELQALAEKDVEKAQAKFALTLFEIITKDGSIDNPGKYFKGSLDLIKRSNSTLAALAKKSSEPISETIRQKLEKFSSNIGGNNDSGKDNV